MLVADTNMMREAREATRTGANYRLTGSYVALAGGMHYHDFCVLAWEHGSEG